LDAGQYQEAINTYNQDLHNLPKNGWALKGLSIAYMKAGDLSKHNETERRFNESWSTSDFELKSSVIK
jgi:Flp pilus assembly protein TadD